MATDLYSQIVHSAPGSFLAKQLGMEVTMFEKFAKGPKDFNILIQKAKASGADAFYPAAYEGDQMVIARQLREVQVDFPVVYMVYASQPQFLQIGRDADWLVSHSELPDLLDVKPVRSELTMLDGRPADAGARGGSADDQFGQSGPLDRPRQERSTAATRDLDDEVPF